MVAQVGRYIALLALKVIGVKVIIKGQMPQNFRHKVVVANHLSYVDIMTLMALLPTRFVTFAEFQNIPGIGILSKISGTLFIHRSQPSRVKKDVLQIEKAINSGSTIVFFPEGSSFDGTELHPFKSSLFQSAIQTKAIVHPVCLRYLDINGEVVSTKNRDHVFYYGDMDLLPQLLGLLKLKSITVEVVFESPIDSSTYNRKELAEKSQAAIQRHFLPVQL
ncbi:MAG: 1-acyl-sn-glycerol-3-phosphate acyltransferase [Bdellovibrionaceae bacterium]|nr:1-acyl-sn-glycerol-3-phosphate acyltransferase [Pseudobdellovibrionaceae bacterium]